MDSKDKAAADLKSAEQAASAEVPEQAEDSLDGARENENGARGLYSGKGGLFKKEKGKKDKKAKLKRALRGKGPLGVIFGLLFSAGGLMMSMQTLLPVAIEEMITQKLNSIGVSSTVASDSWLDTQLNYGIREGDIDKKSNSSMFGISPWQVQSLEREGFKAVKVRTDAGDVSAILYQSGDEWIPVVGSDYLNSSSYNESQFRAALASASGKSNIGKPVSTAGAMKDDDFKIAYTTASKTWRGGASGWFDNIMEKVTETKLSINRNRWTRSALTGVKAISKGFKALAKNNKMVQDGGFDSNVADQDTGDVKTMTDNYQYDEHTVTKDSNGKEITSMTSSAQNDVDIENDSSTFTVSTTDDNIAKANNGGSKAYETAQKILQNKALKTAGAVASGLDFTCTIAEALMTLYNVASAYQGAQFLNTISGFLEASSIMKAGKMSKAGEGSDNPYNEYSNAVTTKTDTVDAVSGEVVAKDKTAMESAGMSWLFSNSEINSKDASIMNVNFEAIMSNVSSFASDVALNAEIFEKCGYVKIASNTISLVTSILSFIPGPGQAIKLTQVAVKIAKKVALRAAVATAVQLVVPKIARSIANYIVKDVATEWFGEDLGNALLSGASKYLGGNGTSGGQSPGGKEAVLAYLGERDEVIADEARYQRAIKSPFDATSPYTFIGSMVYSLLPIAFSGGGVLSTLRQVSSLTSSAFSSLFPTASAIDKNSALNSQGDCELLKSQGIIGDAFCNPYIITDVSTLATSPIAVNEIVYNLGNDVVASASMDDVRDRISSNFNSDGSINEDSELARYLIYCGQRTSPYGVRDASIAAQVSGDDNSVVGLLGFIPVIGDFTGIVTNAKYQNNMEWVSGQACVASEENPKWNSEYKWYQRYAENMRLVENMNPGYKSEVTAFLEKQYEKNPVDTSFEGTLARFSGLSKETVEDTLAIMDYYNYIANYDPASRFTFGEDIVEEPVENYFSDDSLAEESHYILPNYIVYTDVRNRQTYTM